MGSRPDPPPPRPTTHASMQGEGDAMEIYNTVSAWNPLGTVWAEQFPALITYLIDSARRDLVQYNPELPVLLGVQKVTGRDRVYPWIGVIRNLTLELNLPNVLKVDMEVRGSERMSLYSREGGGVLGGTGQGHVVR